MRYCLSAVFVCGLFTASAQSPGPSLSVDAAANRKPISPDIYGINDYDDQGLAQDARVTVRRWGGDQSTRYNWKLNTYNAAADWYFGNYQIAETGKIYPDGLKTNEIIENSRRTGSKVIHTIPMIGWLPKSRDRGCSYSVRKYGPQREINPYEPDCGKGVLLNGREIQNDPNDVSAFTDESLQREWIEYMVKRYGFAAQGGVGIYSLDNETTIWQFVHKDVHPADVSYDELLDTGIRFASMIKAADPGAKVTGPVHSGWMAFFYSAKDWRAGWSTKAPWKYWTTPIDRNAHGGLDITAWYLQQMRAYEQRTATRLLDYLDLHAYVIPDGLAFQPAGDAAKQDQRLNSVRAFWDPSYQPMAEDPFEPPRLIPRMREWVETHYPGTKTAITEYNFGGHEHINGALALADALGVFGREGLDLAAIWGAPKPQEPAAFAFRLYRNYDGRGSEFGETSVSSISDDQSRVSVYAAERTDSALTIALINKTASILDTPLRLANFTPAPSAEVWRYSAASLSRIERDNNLPVVEGTFTVRLPAQSLTLLVLPLSNEKLKAPRPKLAAVRNAASYSEAVAPGTMVTLFGENMGPKDLAYAGANQDGFIDREVAGTRVLVNGSAAPLIYASAGQVAAIIPYEAGLSGVAQVQVERLGSRSEGVEIQVLPSGPGVFATNAQGFGQGAVLNQDSSRNGAANPEERGRVVQIFATGEGQTRIPSVNGLLARAILPEPALPVKAEIDGILVDPEYAGAAPGAVAGTLQVNVRIPDRAQSGNVSLRLKIGERWSQDRITIAVK